MTDTYTFDLNLSTERYTIEIDTAASYGYFQNNQTGTEGGLWFDGKTLVDYDGVAVLPKQVEDALTAKGYSLDDDEDEDEAENDKPAKRPITDYRWYMDVIQNHTGLIAIVAKDGTTICNPSPMGEGIAKLVAATPAMLQLILRGIECGIFADAPEYEQDVLTVMKMIQGDA